MQQRTVKEDTDTRILIDTALIVVAMATAALVL
jgi:hypothetical protein